MEILGTTQACFVVDDDLLDFTLEGGNDEEEAVDPKASASACVSASASASASASSSSSRPKALPFFFGTQDGLFPEFAEEELEWLSNKDAFPAIETCFGILSDNPQLVSTHQSPISVLENSSITSSHSNSDNNSISVASCCNNSLAVPAAGHPVRARSKRRRRTLGFGDLLPGPARASKLPRSAADGSRAGRKCTHCRTEKTPQWRAGPMGPKTLCNACGVRYKSGRLLPEYRPASSPTFSNELHSNSHRKVVEMRRKKQMAAEEEEGIMVNVPVVSCGYNVG